MNSFENILYDEDSFIGEGGYRKVYHCKLSDDWVVKIAKDLKGMQHNILENNVWSVVVGREEHKWFAPVIQMSDDGMVLIQRRTDPIIHYPYSLPDKIPIWLSDIKNINFGFIDKQLVTHDYAFTFDLLIRGLSKKMTKVSWRW